MARVVGVIHSTISGLRHALRWIAEGMEGYAWADEGRCLQCGALTDDKYCADHANTA